MADDPIKEPPDQPDQLSLQTSPATAGAADQPVIATSFHAFALLPEEIRRQIWQYASISTRMHVLKFPNFCLLPPAGPLEDPTLASHYNYAGIADDLAMLISNSDNYPSTWHVPRCLKFRKFFWRCDLNRIGAVCPEAREAYLSFRQQAEHSRLKLSKGVHVNDSFDIFHFSESTILPATATFLLTMRPRLRPINIAIEVSLDRPNSYFIFDEDGDLIHNLPIWLFTAIQWGREAREGYNNSPATSLTPSIDDVMIDLQDLQAVFLLDPAIKFRLDSRPLAHQYNVFAHGMESHFYGISPGNEEIMKYWDVPAHSWPVLDEMKRVLRFSDNWKVNVYLMASVKKKTRPIRKLGW